MPIQQMPPGAVDMTDRIDDMADAARERRKRKSHAAGNGKANGTGHRFTLTRFHDVPLVTSSPYLLKGFIPREGLVVVWGPPKCGKTFWTFDLVLHVALGWQYRGQRVTQGPVVYVACEGERGLGARVAAFKLKHGISIEDPQFYLVTTRLDLVADHRPLVADIRAQLDGAEPVAIVIDTLNRSIPGSESDDRDMSDYVKAADAVREAFSCAVIVIHHCGVEGTRPRGHTSLTGAADAQIAVKRDASGFVTATVEWLKDGAEGETMSSKLEVVEVGADEDGEPITSCVIVPADGEPPNARTAKRSQKLTDRQTIAKQAIVNYFAAGHGEPAPVSNHVPRDAKTALRHSIIDALENATVAKEVANSRRRREAIGRILESLQSRGIIGAYGDWVWLAKPSDAGDAR